MATLKSLTALCRRQLVAVTGMHSVIDGLSFKSALNVEKYAVTLSRQLSGGVQSIHRATPSSHNYSHNRPTGLERLDRHQEPSISSNVVASSHKDTDNRFQYICPSRLSQLLSNLAILDSANEVKSFYDCPVVNHRSSGGLIFPPIRRCPSQDKAEIREAPAKGPANIGNIKEAKEIMRIRHRKMKKHKLRKLRKRMYFLWKKQKATRKAKRDAIYWKEISTIKQQADDFNAEDFVKNQLEKARKGGFYIKVLD